MFLNLRKLRRRKTNRASRDTACAEGLEQRLLLAVNWTNPGGGDWDVGSNWSTGQVPGVNDSVYISTASAATVTIQSGDTISLEYLSTSANDLLSITGGSATINGAVLYGGLSMTGGQVSVSEPGSSLEIAGKFTGSGQGTLDIGLDGVMIDSPGATFSFPQGMLQLYGSIKGPGALTNTGYVAVVGNIDGESLWTTLDNAGVVIDSDNSSNGFNIGTLVSGEFGSGNGVLDNESGGTFQITNGANVNGAGTFNNDGTVRKTDNSATVFQPALNNNADGVIELDQGSLAINGQPGIDTGGAFNIATGASLIFGTATTTTFTGSYTGTGQGTVNLENSVSIGPAGATFDFPQGLLQWGSIQGPGTLTNAGFMTIAGNANGQILPPTVNNDGTIIDADTPGNGITIGTGGTLTNESGGTFDITDGATISGAGTFINDGTLLKTGDNAAEFQAALNNGAAGVIEVDQASLNADGGGTDTGGTFNVAAGASLIFGAATTLFTGTYTGTGQGTVNLETSVSIAPAGATFDFPQGLLQWGSIQGPGTLTNAGCMTIAGNANGQILPPTVDNNGTIIDADTSGNGIAIGSGDVLNNQAGAIFQITGDGNITGNGTLNNYGTFEKTAGGGMSTIACGFNNIGATIDVEKAGVGFTGTLSITGGSLTGDGPGVTVTATGTTTASDVNFYALNGATVSLPELTSYTENENTTIMEAQGTGSVLSLQRLTSVDFPNGPANGVGPQFEALAGGLLDLRTLAEFVFNIGATLGGTVKILSDGQGSTVNLAALSGADYTSFTASNGSTLSVPSLASCEEFGNYPFLTCSGTGSILSLAVLTTVTINPKFLAAPSPAKARSGGTIHLPSLASGQVYLESLGAGSVISVPSLASVNGLGLAMVGDSGVIDFPNGAATMPGSENAVTINVPTLPTGAVLELAADGTLGGGTTFNVAAGDTVQVSSGFQTSDGAFSFSGTFNGGATFNGGQGAKIDLSWCLAPAWGNYNAGTPTGVTYSGPLVGVGVGAGTVELNNGTVWIGQAGLSLNFPGNMFQWSGGALVAAQGENVSNLGTMNLTGRESFVSGGVLDDFGTIIQTGGNISGETDALNIGSSGSATLKIETGASYVMASGPFGPLTLQNASQGSIINAGTLKSSGGASLISGYITNSGTLEVDTGTLTLGASLAQFSSGALTGGTWIVGNGATLNFPSGDNITTNQANVTLNGSSASFPQLAGMTTDQGTLNLLGGKSFSATGDLMISGTLTIDTGTLTMNGHSINILTGGVLNLGNANGLSNPGLVNDAGAFNKTSDSGTMTIGCVFNVQGGTVGVQQGAVNLTSGGGTDTGGTFNIATGAAFYFSAGVTTLAGTYTGSGGGTVHFAGGEI
ncbi:MAG: hypothetical protein ABSH20_22900, partial [Tepidisphaeraceae bacterium]